MCQLLDMQAVQRMSYVHALDCVRRLVGCDNLNRDFSTLPIVRAKALDGRLADIYARLDAAAHFAGSLGWNAATALMRQKRNEIMVAERAARGVADMVEVVVLDSDWGKKGRGAKIVAWIISTGSDAEEIARRFQLAISTAKNYVRRARRSDRD